MIRFSNFLWLIILSVFVACSDRKIDTTAAKEEMKAREIKVIPEAQILEKTKELGDNMIAGFSISLKDSTAEMPIALAELKKQNIKTPEAHFYLFDQANSLKGKEKMLFEAYQYNAKSGIASEANVQDIPESKALLYTSPIITEQKTIGMWSIKIPRKLVVMSIDN